MAGTILCQVRVLMQSAKYSHSSNFHRFILSPISTTLTNNSFIPLFPSISTESFKPLPWIASLARLVSIVHIQRSAHLTTHRSLQLIPAYFGHTWVVHKLWFWSDYSLSITALFPFSSLSVVLMVGPDRLALDHCYYSYAVSLFSTYCF